MELLRTGGSGARLLVVAKFSMPCRPAPRPNQPPVQWKKGVKRLQHGDNRSPPSSVGVWKAGFISCVPLSLFSYGLCISCVPGCWLIRVLVESCGQFSGITVVYQAAEDNRVQGTVVRCGVAQWVKLSDSWPKFKFAEFHTMSHHIIEHKIIFCK